MVFSSQHLRYSHSLLLDKDAGFFKENGFYSFKLSVKVALDLGNLLIKLGFYVFIHDHTDISAHHGIARNDGHLGRILL